MKNLKLTFSLTALASGIFAVILAFSSGNGGLTYEAKSNTPNEKGIGYFKEKILNKKSDKSENSRKFEVLNTGVFVFGLVAVVLGLCASFIKRRNKSHTSGPAHFYFDTSSVALTLGLVALLWSYIMLAIILGVVFYIFSGLISGSIDIGF